MGDDGSDRSPDEDTPLSDLAHRVAARRRRHGDATSEDDATADDAAASEEPAHRAADDETRGETPEGSAPLSDLARRVGERRGSRSKGGDDALFDEMNVGEVDEETLWASLTDFEAAEAAHVGAEASAEEVRGDVPGYVDHLVPKAEFCQQCPYLADPPELACEHEDTEIVEVVDSDRFRVRECPMVGENE